MRRTYLKFRRRHETAKKLFPFFSPLPTIHRQPPSIPPPPPSRFELNIPFTVIRPGKKTIFTSNIIVQRRYFNFGIDSQ